MQLQLPLHQFTKETAQKSFRHYWSLFTLHDELLEICLDVFEEIHGHRESQLPKRSSSELIDWYFAHTTFNEKTQNFDTYNPYQRIERSDIYYDVCGWIK